MGEIFPISSIHGLGIGELLDAIYENFPEEKERTDDDDWIKVAVIGKPNVGKSSVINKILGEERYSEQYTRNNEDAIDTYYETDGKDICLLIQPA